MTFKTTTLICPIGIPGSGKTHSRDMLPKDTLIASRDDIREHIRVMGNLERYKFTKEREKSVSFNVDGIISYGIKNAKEYVYVDETFCNLKNVKSFISKWSDLANIEWRVAAASYNPDLCHKRNTERNASVPYEVIERMHEGFLEVVRYLDLEEPWLGKAEDYVYDENKLDCIIVDIDGTIADYADLRSPFEWDKVDVDLPKQHVIDVIRAYLTVNPSIRLVVMSGRDGSCRDKTVAWLDEHMPFWNRNYLFMREADDTRKDYIIKMELLRKHVLPDFNVKAAFDDRRQVVRYWRRAAGIKVFQVEDGLF